MSSKQDELEKAQKEFLRQLSSKQDEMQRAVQAKEEQMSKAVQQLEDSKRFALGVKDQLIKQREEDNEKSLKQQ